jgi:DNA-binding transcriptional regulator PaaX
VYPDKTIRAGLSRLVKTGVLGTNGKRRGLRYSQI